MCKLYHPRFHFESKMATKLGFVYIKGSLTFQRITACLKPVNTQRYRQQRSDNFRCECNDTRIVTEVIIYFVYFAEPQFICARRFVFCFYSSQGRPQALTAYMVVQEPAPKNAISLLSENVYFTSFIFLKIVYIVVI